MADENNVPPDAAAKQRLELFEQVAAVFALNGMTMSDDLMTYMQPLLDGTLSYEEHRVMLESMIKRLEA